MGVGGGGEWGCLGGWGCQGVRVPLQLLLLLLTVPP